MALLGKFSNLRLGVYTPYAHEKRIQSLYLHFLHHYNYKIKYLNHIRGLNFRNTRAKHVGVIGNLVLQFSFLLYENSGPLTYLKYFKIFFT